MLEFMRCRTLPRIHVLVLCVGGWEWLSQLQGLGNLQKYAQGERVTAGWPPWLRVVADEAKVGCLLELSQLRTLKRSSLYKFSIIIKWVNK